MNDFILELSNYHSVTLKEMDRVKLMNRRTNNEINYLLVSAEEADFEQNKLSVTSPLGKALLGRVVGDVVETKVPAGVIQYEVLAIGK